MAKPDCKDCSGTGWIVSEKDGISAADRCPCVAEAYAEQLEGKAQIPENYKRVSLESFNFPLDNPIAERGLKAAFGSVRSFVEHYPKNQKPGLLLIGQPGAGKTHLAVSALKKLISRGHEGIFFDYQNLLERIRSSYNEKLGTSDREAYKVALDTEILLLDDLGAHRVTDWVEDTVTAIVTHRYNHRKTLIATTNLIEPAVGGVAVERSSLTGARSFRTTLEDRIGERARSRLFEMCKVIQMPDVNDYRIKPSRP